MKRIIMVVMAVLALTGPASATSGDDLWGTALNPANSGWDYFWGTTLNPANTGWDYFWGTSLNTQQTGWDDFWNQCQDPTKTAGDCVGTVAAGIGLAVASPILLLTASNVVGFSVISIISGTPTILLTPAQLIAAG